MLPRFLRRDGAKAGNPKLDVNACSKLRGLRPAGTLVMSDYSCSLNGCREEQGPVISGALTSTKEAATEKRIPQAQVSAHADLMRVVLGGICVVLCMARGGGGPSCLAGSSAADLFMSAYRLTRALCTVKLVKQIDERDCIFIFAYTCVTIGIFFL